MKRDEKSAFHNWLQSDPLLKPYQPVLLSRFNQRIEKKNDIIKKHQSLYDFAASHTYLGLHHEKNQWVFREWAPFASQIFFVGDVTGWKEKKEFQLTRTDPEGIWTLCFPENVLHHGELYRLRIHWKDGQGDRIPAYARRVVQDPVTLIFNAQVWNPESAYQWKSSKIDENKSLLIYEAHVGMAQDAEKVGSFKEFTENIIPRILKTGYNTIQLMAIQEHPYYGSFGYQVSSFFAVSSRFGTPDEFKELIDTAHGSGLKVIMDMIHSHAVINEVEGLSRFDGSTHQYFHDGPKGLHPAWNSRCFDYQKSEVLAFLLSNCRFWLEEYQLDGFRFDGVTSMMYDHHGLGKAFTGYSFYFDESVDEGALTYLSLANTLIHEINPDAITIAEDVSGMPGLAVPVTAGGIGFDYRFAMGIPDYWIRLTKEYPDESWPIGHLWFELTNRRPDEKTISYTESHDQALVGDQTLIFRLMGSDMYDAMSVNHKNNLRVERGMALHRLIRFITIITADSGYLNFMGNEFGHPEWIDFPREGNNWSYRFARRQWHLVDNPKLRYHFLARFDQEMITLVKAFRLFESPRIQLLYEHNHDEVIAIERAGLFFLFNFHPTISFSDYQIPFSPGKYEMIFHSDLFEFGGHERLKSGQIHFTRMHAANNETSHFISLYLPSRTALVLQSIDSKS
ncbi:MAG: alpha amylase C-terminal domain-containing protein [Deltaproteobacteria bacterium]|nr:alpha amylase C-terminal domain-containing protein [Deltaproteobacteria bacterium]